MVGDTKGVEMVSAVVVYPVVWVIVHQKEVGAAEAVGTMGLGMTLNWL